MYFYDIGKIGVMVDYCYDYTNLVYFSDMWMFIHTFILANAYVCAIKCNMEVAY